MTGATTRPEPTRAERWVFVSPHADDAIWSVGGIIACCSAMRETTLVTIFAPPPDCRATREAEDRAAAGVLGCRLVSLGLPEARSRRNETGNLYRSSLALRRKPLANDPAAAAVGSAVAEVFPGASAIFVPLATHSHVDHVIVRDAVLACAEPSIAIMAYPEFPYHRHKTESLSQNPALPCDPVAWLAAATLYSTEAIAMFGTRERFEHALRDFISERTCDRSGNCAQSIIPLRPAL
ncbi:PIG-L family deacetylase [Sphingomonas sp. DG1-23]|uniref:PIG-L deacetylase family protein n=1 Tax=Sphingomonas sp. DG1-23 TaxID=3068316 RepID=UPI00273FE8BA|nr:PIG-L family deacetylase [Sphingomonas sp. DG1-23]MDP5278674.1 PIG-L family deacetylase [Sphingomonas sp. DG1-23]